MKQKIAHFMLTVCLFAGLTVLPAQADIGLGQILASDGLTAVGQAVREAVEGIYRSTDDPKAIEDQIVAIVNEAVETGDGEAVRYTLIAVMMAGGAENLDLSKVAIDNSAAFTSFPSVTATTVTVGSALIAEQAGSAAAGGVAADSGGGSLELGGGAELGGGQDEELGGGKDDDPLEDGDATDIMSDDGDVEIIDGDTTPTPV